MKRHLGRLCVMVLVLASAATARAELMLGTGLNVLSTNSITIPVYWDGSGNASIASFYFDFRLTGGTSGGLEVDYSASSSSFIPATNRIWPDVGGSPNYEGPYANTTAGTGGIAVYSNSLDGNPYTFTSSGASNFKNAVTFTVRTASGTPSGTFNLWAQTGTNKTSYTADGVNDLTFGNTSSIIEGTNTGILLGTVTVAPVPEPSTLVFLTSGAVCVLGLAWRRRRRSKASQTPPAATA